MHRISLLAIILCLVFGSFGVAENKLSEELERRLADARDLEKIPVVIYYDGMPSFEEVSREYRFLGSDEVIREQAIRVMKENAESLHYWLRQTCESPAMIEQVEGFTSMWIVNAVSLKATHWAIREIAQQPTISKIVLDEPVPMLFEDNRSITWGVQKINAPGVWQYYDGKGVIIAVADTGVNEHSDLAGRVIDGKNYITPGTAPRDDHGHGTHCAGTVAGDGAAGTQTGVAPKATIVSIKVLSASGSGAWSNLYLAIEEAVETNAKVVSMSLGGFPTQDIRDRLRLACKNCIAAKIIPVIAAGNSGTKGIGSPGDVPEVITVGATDSADSIAYFSSVGPTTWEGHKIVKPDISAPGVSILSCSHTSNGYTTMSGTSMATPHVAGLVGLMWEANPHLNTVLAKKALEDTATDLGTPGKDNSYGSGRVNADKAVTMTQSLSQSEERFEMVVKEMAFETMVDANGNIYIQKVVENDALPATVTIWVDALEPQARQGIYHVKFSMDGPAGIVSGTAKINYDNIPTNPNLYNPQYGFNVGNFEMKTGQFTGTVESLEPNAKVKNVKVTIRGKATWPARAAN